jgi:hypothetical protein
VPVRGYLLLFVRADHTKGINREEIRRGLTTNLTKNTNLLFDGFFRSCLFVVIFFRLWFFSFAEAE